MPPRLAVVKVSLLPTTPAVIFWLWLMILPVRMDRLCPEGCRCFPKANKVLCHYVPLNKIPFIFPRNVQELSFYNNNVTNLENDTFISRGLTELKMLIITRCKLETIEVGAFNGLTKLNYLKLGQNYLSEILPGTFEGMSSLISLVLRNNRIEYLDVNIFSGLINLVLIDLGGNTLQNLHPDTFVELPKLITLKISDNLELQIPTDSHFISSHSLTYLRISDCNVMSLSAETFANVTALEWLDLSHNKLTSVDIDILKELSKLSALYLDNNPLQCDCRLQEVWRWCQDHNIGTEDEERAPVCDTPSEVQGKYWGVVETGQCLQDNMHYYGDNNNISHSYVTSDNTNISESGLSSLELFFLILEGLLYVFGTAGNVIIVIIIIHNKEMRTAPNMHILNLAINDMIFITANFLLFYIWRAFMLFIYNGVIQFALLVLLALSTFVSACSIIVLSIKRYTATVNPFDVHVSSQPTWRNTVATIFGVWIVAALILILPCAVIVINSYIPYFLTFVKYVIIYALLMFYLLPVCVIAYFSFMTSCHLLKSSDSISDKTRNHQMNQRRTSAKVLFGLTFAFLISNFPLQALFTYYVFISDQKPNHGIILDDIHVEFHYVSIVGPSLVLLYPCLNPVALFCTSRAFRKYFKRYLTCLCKTNNSVGDFIITRRN